MQRSGKKIDRKDGFGGGFDSIKEGIEKRSKDDWGGNGTGGASGKLGGGDVTDFAAYMAKRAAEAGGTVLISFVNELPCREPRLCEFTWGRCMSGSNGPPCISSEKRTSPCFLERCERHARSARLALRSARLNMLHIGHGCGWKRHHRCQADLQGAGRRLGCSRGRRA